MTAISFVPRASLTAARRRPHAPALERRSRRQTLTVCLGLLWLLDAGLQFQPFMYTTAFPNDFIKPAGAGSPSWISTPNSWAASLMAGHITTWNTLFALTQFAIGAGLLFRRSRKPALALSILWALLVWWLGEALGGGLAGPVSPLMGHPGAVVIYAIVAALLWPPAVEAGGEQSLADRPGWRQAVARGTWFLLWASFAFEALRPANRAPSALHDMLQDMEAGQPAWIKAIDRLGVSATAHHGTEIAVGLFAVFAFIAVGVFSRRLIRPAVVAALVVAAVSWIFAQNFGGLATGVATDPNAAPALALLALCYLPIAARTSSSDPEQPRFDPAPLPLPVGWSDPRKIPG
jgi:hypothetical protein